MKTRECQIKSFAVLVLVAALLSAGAGSAAEQEIPWHVPEAEIRIPLTVDIEQAVSRMPPRVYLADLHPLENTGITFDAKSKNANPRDIRGKEERDQLIAKLKRDVESAGQKWNPDMYDRRDERDGGALMMVQGSATYALKPEYKWFSRAGLDMSVYVDGATMGSRETIPIPPGAKTLKVEGKARYLHQPGFITNGPSVAHATLCLPGRDPTSLIPIVRRLSGEQVGCRILWSHPEDPMSILFDCSSGDARYMVYLVAASMNPQRLPWVPRAGIVQETRNLDRYDPAVQTWEGFRKLWDGAGFIAGKRVPIQRAGSYHNDSLRDHTTLALHEAGWLPFGPARGDTRGFFSLTRAAPPSLSRYTGFFHIPAAGTYQFHFHAYPGGYLSFDDQLVSEMPYGYGGFTVFAVDLEQGLHRVDLCLYGGRGERFGLALRWNSPAAWHPRIRDADRLPEVFGQMEGDDAYSANDRLYRVWEPMAVATAGALSSRAQPSFASFAWSHRDTYYKQKHRARNLKYYPQDINSVTFVAGPYGSDSNTVFRWRFDDGHTVEGPEVIHDFLSIGTRQVRLEVLDGPGGKVMASASGKLYVNANWALARARQRGEQPPTFWPIEYMFNRIWNRADEFSSLTPIEEVVNVYYWTHESPELRTPGHTTLEIKGDWLKLRNIAVAAMAKRSAEIIEKLPYHRLLDLAQNVSVPTAVADYDMAEKFLKAVMDRAPAGSDHWRDAALTLADIHVSVRDKPEAGLGLVETVKKTRWINDLNIGWEAARARRYYLPAPGDKLNDLAKGLEWTKTGLPLEVMSYVDRGFWLARDIEVPASFNGKELVLDPGPINHDGAMWLNGEPLGELRGQPDGSIVIPAAMLRRGGPNRFTALILPLNRHGFFPRVSPPVLSPDFHQLVRNHDGNGIYLQTFGGSVREGYFGPRPLREVQAFAFSPDGKRLASGQNSRPGWHDGGRPSGGRDGAVKIWDVNTKQELLSFDERSGTVWSLAFSPDGTRLASGNADQQVRLWDAANGKQLLAMNANSGDVISLAFSPDGKRLASGARHRTVKVWDTASGKQLLSLDGHSGAVHAMAFSPDGKSLATGIDAERIRLWDAATGAALRTLEGQTGEVLSLAFSPDGTRLASGSYDRQVGLWDLETGNKVATGGGHGNCVTTVAFSPDGKQLVSVGLHIKYWNADTLKEERDIANVADQTAQDETLWVHGPGTLLSGVWTWNSIGSFSDGPRRAGRGGRRFPDYDSYPVEVFTAPSCEVAGVNYACYRGEKWDKLPDFDTLKPVTTGIIQRIDASGVGRALLPYEINKDGRRVRQSTGMKVAGCLRVTTPDDYEFSLTSADGSRLMIDSKLVIDNDGARRHAEEKRGAIHLDVGVHPFTVIYSHDTEGDQTFGFTFPESLVRTLRQSEVAQRHIEADALLALGKTDEAVRILMNLERGAWPIDEGTHLQLSADVRTIRRLANAESDNTDEALGTIDTWMDTHPMLRTVPGFMVARVELLAATGDHARAFTLAGQLRRMDMTDRERWQLMLVQVKAMITAGNMDAARELYQELNRVAPYNEATLAARDAITKAVLRE